MGDPRLLADLTGIPVIYDFRSDDLMNGGEGAPLAPLHNRRIARMMQNKGFDSVAFCNGGNTGNIAVIGREEGSKTSAVAGLGYRTVQSSAGSADAGISGSAF